MAVNSADKCLCSLEENTHIVEKYGSTYANTTKIHYTWTIHNFNCLPNENGYEFKSPVFSGGEKNEYKWQLRAYPNGFKKEAINYLSLYLGLVLNGKPEIKAISRLCLLNENKEEVEIKSTEIRMFENKSYGYCGWYKFAALSFLQNAANGLLPNDSLMILCDISVFEGTIEIDYSNEFDMPKCRLVADLSDLFESMEFSDVTLIACHREFRAHKAILAARSAVFLAMFRQDMLEQKENRVNITDVDDDVLMELLRFIYTGKVTNMDKLADRLLAAADKYDLDRLKGLCEKTLSKTLTFDNAASRLILGDRHDAVQLKARALNFICYYTKKVFETISYKSMLVTYPYLVHEVFQAFIEKTNSTESRDSSSNRNKKKKLSVL